MVLLPVVARELRVKARGKAAYRTRFWAVLLVLALLFWFVNFSANSQSAPNFGMEVMQVLLVPAFVFALFIGVVATADCVSSEKRDGTLGLLFLTDLRGYDVICGKLAANSINALYGLIAILPVLSLSVMLGGVTFMQFARLALVLLTTMMLSLATGIFVSTYSRNERKAMFFTVLLLLTATCLPVLMLALDENSAYPLSQKDVWVYVVFSPVYGIPETLSPTAGFPAYGYWLSLLWQWLLSAALIARASSRVPHSWEDSGVKKPKPAVKKTTARSQSHAPRDRLWLERNPFLWLALQGEEASLTRVWMFVVAVLMFWIMSGFQFGMRMMADEDLSNACVYFINTMMKVWIAGEAARRFCEDRNNNTFEFLLATPLTVRQIIWGQWLALLKQFAKPIAIVLAWETFMLVFSLTHHYGASARPMDYWPKMLLLVADSVALAWVGMWFGLKSKTRIRAILATLTVVLFVPYIAAMMFDSVWEFFVMLPGSGYGVGSAWKNLQATVALIGGGLVDLVVILWATSSLPQSFRKLAIRG